MNLQLIKKICQQYDIMPSKSKGQNFLFDQNIIDKILMAADLKIEDTVLEVGPGLGVLTGGLVSKAKKVLAVELDKKLAQFLKIEFFQAKNLKIIEQDVLKLNLNELSLDNFGYKVVANLPYNITSIFLRNFFEQSPKPKEMILMIQKEVAQRMLPKKGEMTLLSLSANFYTKTEILFFVSKNSFWPAPKVDSAVIKIQLKKDDELPQVDQKKFWRLAKMGFSAKRKQLHNNLASGLKISNEEAKKILRKNNLDEKIRAQDLSLDEWVKLCQDF